MRLRAGVFEPQLVVLKVSRPRFVCFFCQSLKHFQENAKNQKKNLQTSADNVISISSSSSAISEHRTSTHLYKRTYTSCSIKTLKLKLNGTLLCRPHRPALTLPLRGFSHHQSAAPRSPARWKCNQCVLLSSVTFDLTAFSIC